MYALMANQIQFIKSSIVSCMSAPPGAERADPHVRRCAKRRRAQEALTWIKSRNLLSWEWALGHPRWQLTKPLNWSTQFTKPLNLRTQNHQTFQIENPNRQTSQIVPLKHLNSRLEWPNHQTYQTQHKYRQGNQITSESTKPCVPAPYQTFW